MVIVLVLSAWIVYPPIVVKSRYLDQSLLINKSLLLIRWWDVHKSRYYTFFRACKLFALVMFALPGWNGLGLNSSLLSDLTAAIDTRFCLGSLLRCC